MGRIRIRLAIVPNLASLQEPIMSTCEIITAVDPTIHQTLFCVKYRKTVIRNSTLTSSQISPVVLDIS